MARGSIIMDQSRYTGCALFHASDRCYNPLPNKAGILELIPGTLIVWRKVDYTGCSTSHPCVYWGPNPMFTSPPNKALYRVSVPTIDFCLSVSHRPCLVGAPLLLATGSAKNGLEWKFTSLKRAMLGTHIKAPALPLGELGPKHSTIVFSLKWLSYFSRRGQSFSNRKTLCRSPCWWRYTLSLFMSDVIQNYKGFPDTPLG